LQNDHFNTNNEWENGIKMRVRETGGEDASEWK